MPETTGTPPIGPIYTGCQHDWRVSGLQDVPLGGGANVQETALLYCTKCADVIRKAVRHDA